MKYLIQDVICKDIPIPNNFDVTIFSNKTELVNILETSDKPPVVFCSTNLLKVVEKFNHISLLPSSYKSNDYRNPLFHNVWNSYVPKEVKLNWDCDYVTLESVINGDYITHLDNLFVRPNSPWKPFAGFYTKSEDLLFELNCRKTLEHLDSHEFIVLSSYKKLDNVEWRCYSFENEIIPVPYSWEDYDKSLLCPTEVMDLVRKVYKNLEYIGNMWVIDIGYFENKPFLIEVNAVSTSGWYAGLNVEKLFNSIEYYYEG